MAPILARFAPRVMIVQAAPPDEDGNVNLSLHLGATRPELLRAGEDPDRLLIVEVNPNLPRTKSLPPEYDNTISLDVVDVLVETNATPFALTEPPTDEVDEAIARNALAYVPNGSTLQTGIGAIPNMVATRAGPRATRRASASTPRCSRRAHASAPGGQGERTTPRGCSTGCR